MPNFVENNNLFSDEDFGLPITNFLNVFHKYNFEKRFVSDIF